MIVYWDGIVANKELAEEYKLLFETILEGNYKEADLDLKKLPHHRVYSVRVNKYDRLLFTTVKSQDNRSYLLLLGEVKNHDYHKSPFLKPSVLAAFLDKNAPVIKGGACIDESSFELYTNTLFEEGFEERNKWTVDEESNKPLTFYNNNFIAFNDAQQHVLQTTLPVVISGAAGSGKSCVAFSLLSTQTGKRLYLTQSKYLVNQMSTLWANSPYADDEVVFKTYDELYLELNSSFLLYSKCGEFEFLKWFEEYKKKSKLTHSNNGFIEWIKQKNNVYQEMRLLSACQNKEACENLSLHDKKERGWLYDVYSAYKQHLLKNKHIDMAFQRFDSQGKYDLFDLIVVDEGQDLSPLQLQELLYLTKDGRIAYCIDSHQSLNDSQSKRPFLLNQLLHKSKKTMQYIELPGSYRCPAAVIDFVNHVLSLKFFLTGGLADKKEFSIIGAIQANKEGVIEWYNTASLPTNKIKIDTTVAVITLSQYKTEAQKRFNTPLVFTVDEIKGLEYATIIVYNLLDEPLFKEANTVFSKESSRDFSCKKTIHQPKNNAGDEQFATPFNRFITAITRTTNTLLIVQEEKPSFPHALIKAFKEGLPKTLPQLSKPQENPLSYDEEENNLLRTWEDEANKLLLMGKVEQARAIFIGKLKKTESEFKSYLKPNDSAEIKLTPSQNKVADSEVRAKKTHSPKTSKQTPVPTQKIELVPIVTPIMSKKDKDVTYLINLLNRLDEKLLKQFFDLKQYARLMWEVPVSPNLNFLCTVLKDKNKSKILCQFLCKNKQYLDKFTTELLYKPFIIERHYLEITTPFYWLAASVYGREILTWLTKNNPSIFFGIPIDVLCGFPPHANGYERATALYFLGATDGLKLLYDIFSKNPQLVQTVFLIFWVLTPNPDRDSLLSIIKNLNAEGNPFAQQIFTLLPNTLKEMTKKTELLLRNLFKTIDYDSLFELFEHVDFESLLFQTALDSRNTLFFTMISRKERFLIFTEFLKENPKYLKKLTAEVLCKPFSVRGHFLENTSLLYYFLGTTEGAGFLITFPLLLKGITAEALCRPSMPINGNLSPLYILAAILNLCNKELTFNNENYLLKMLVEINPHLLCDITAEGLCHAPLGDSETTLFWLCHFEENHAFLLQLFTVNPKLLEEIPAIVWRPPLKSNPQDDYNVCPLMELTRSPIGDGIAQMVLDKNSDLLKKMAFEAKISSSKEGFFSTRNISEQKKGGANEIVCNNLSLQDLPLSKNRG